MPEDIVARLRSKAKICSHGIYYVPLTDGPPEFEYPCRMCSLPKDAADEIERLRAELTIVTKALQLACEDVEDFQVSDQISFDEHIGQLVNEYMNEARRG